MAYTDTWNSTFEGIPADSENISQGADRIRDFKLAIRERMQKDHYFDPAGTDDDHGEHKKVTFHEPITTPSAVVEKGFCYTKDVDSKAELHFLDEDGNEVQITSKGSLNITVFPSGTKMFFYQDTAPTGWTIDTTIPDRLLSVKGGSAAYNVSGGIEAGTWTQPTHTHTVSNHKHEVPAAFWNSTTVCSLVGTWPHGTSGVSRSFRGVGGSTTTTQETYLSSAAGAQTSSASRTVNTWRPAAGVGIIATKD